MKVTKQGRIIKGIGGFYTVLADDGSTCVCKARGLFRKQAKTPLVGDIVEFSYDEEREKRERTASESFCDAAHTVGGSNGYLMNLLPRKNELIRPAAANIDRLLIVVAASRPEPDLLLADKLLVCCEKLKIDPVMVINKCDEDAEGSAERIAADGEGATKFLKIHVHGTKSFADAKAVGMAVANSPLVKTAFFGEDPNWGRVICAVGYAGVPMDPEKTVVSFGGIPVYAHGVGAGADKDALAKVMAEHDIVIDVDLADGDAEATVFSCDFSYEYVKINGEDHT